MSKKLKSPKQDLKKEKRNKTERKYIVLLGVTWRGNGPHYYAAT
jgi:hypothetical protein